ncbi:MAG: VTT domain-containing protein [Rhodospirillales bacterium]|nr:VTT domain-containing protein [Rhodospirillales bacterium]MCW8861963.1 VTT domain-containing protein [Rhodospirillales bacterium]MCW8953022.1 VTT domain-containing protein [Rhodospirillales bacterium]MCW8970061.1 VTT domain-containing protein [Rhodospirillales bacterium]MCW9001857.1 VTT domain-containing protein [Rhodospirillales bacterium]
MDLRSVIKGLVMIGAFAAFGLLIKLSGLADVLDTAWIDTQVKGRGLAGEALFFVAAAFFTSIGLPRQIISFLGGYAFGFVMGTALALLATVGGCIAAFTYARVLGRSFVRKRAPERIRKVDAFLSGNTFSMAVLIRLLPVGNNFLTNLAAGVSGASALRFVAGSALGYIPQTAVFALVGSGINVDPAMRIGLSAVMFIAAAGLGVHLYHRFGRSKGDEDEVIQALGEAGGDALAGKPGVDKAGQE